MAADNKGAIQLSDQHREMLSKLNHIASMVRFLEIYQGKKQNSTSYSYLQRIRLRPLTTPDFRRNTKKIFTQKRISARI